MPIVMPGVDAEGVAVVVEGDAVVDVGAPRAVFPQDALRPICWRFLAFCSSRSIQCPVTQQRLPSLVAQGCVPLQRLRSKAWVRQ